MKKFVLFFCCSLMGVVAQASGNGVERLEKLVAVPDVACKVTPAGEGDGTFVLKSSYPVSEQGYSSNLNVDAINNRGKTVDMAGYAEFEGMSGYPSRLYVGITHWDPSAGYKVDTVKNKIIDLQDAGGMVDVTVTGTSADGITMSITCKSIKTQSSVVSRNDNLEEAAYNTQLRQGNCPAGFAQTNGVCEAVYSTVTTYQGTCPAGMVQTDYGCFPQGGCPDGYAKVNGVCEDFYDPNGYGYPYYYR